MPGPAAILKQLHHLRLHIAELDTRIEQALTIYRARYSDTGIYDCTVYPGIVPMLERLQAADVAMCIATSKRRDFAERVIDHLDLRHYVRTVYGALPGGGLDHKYDLVAHILTAEGFAAANCTMLGDRLHDIEAAKRNAIASIGALWGYGGRTELEEAGADAIAATPAEVAPLVLGGLAR